MNQSKGIILALTMLLPLSACAEQAQKDVQDTEKVKAVEYGVPATPEKTPVNVPAVAKVDFKEGVHYIKLPQRVTPLLPASKIEVVEMFYYGCPHCFNLEPYVVVWKDKAADDVVFNSVPAVLNPSWGVFARAFYAAEELGILDKTHETLFKSIHEQGRRITSEDALVRFYVRMGAEEAAFRKAMKSDAVAAKVKRAESLGKQYGMTGVPSLVVDGQYRVLLDNVASYDQLFDIVEFLLDKVRKSRSQTG